MNACPYGHPQIDEVTGLSVKCDSCAEWREAGYLPACVEACPYRALDFGDVEELAAKYGADLVTTLPVLGEDTTGSHTLIKARSVAIEDEGVPIVL